MFRDTALGMLLRLVTRNRLFLHPEERPGFELPAEYLSTSSSSDGLENPAQLYPTVDPEIGLQTLNEATKITDGIKVVTWYSENDSENPQNWSTGKKTFVTVVLFAYTFAAYIGSSLYTASIPGIREKFDVSETVAGLGLALYVWGYGVGPMILSPLSEIPKIGRNPPYAISFALFAILTLPMSLANNMAGILVLRFLLGVLCSPALATVGASYADFMRSDLMEYVIVLWGGGASFAPVSWYSFRWTDKL